MNNRCWRRVLGEVKVDGGEDKMRPESIDEAGTIENFNVDVVARTSSREAGSDIDR